MFIGPADERLNAALHDALTAQLSGASMPLVFSRFASDDTPLRAQVDQAKARSLESQALGVFWIDSHVPDDWLVYLLADAKTLRVLVRHIHVEPAAPDAATEAVAVITRESSESLRNGQTPVMQPLIMEREPTPFEPPRPPPPPPPPPPLPLGRYQGFSLWAGYHGDYLASGFGWQNGIRVAAGYRDKVGLYGTLGYSFQRDVWVESDELTFRLTRSPLDVALGYAVPFGRFVPAVELRFLAELYERGNVSTSEPLEATNEGTRVMGLIGPRLRLDFALSRSFSIGAAVGIDLALNRFSFVSRTDSGERALLEPVRVRPVLEVGVTAWP